MPNRIAMLKTGENWQRMECAGEPCVSIWGTAEYEWMEAALKQEWWAHIVVRDGNMIVGFMYASEVQVENPVEPPARVVG